MSASTCGAWAHSCGRVHYYTLDNECKPVEPFGKIGPFPSPREVRDAVEKLSAWFPSATIVSRKRSLDEGSVTDSALNTEFTKALRKLAVLGRGHA